MPHFAAPLSVTQAIQALPPQHEKDPDIGEFVEKALLQQFVPSCVVIDEQSNILYFHGKTGQYLEPASGEASWNLLRMMRDSLRIPLGAAVHKAIKQRQLVVHENVRLETEDGFQMIKVSVQPMADLPPNPIFFWLYLRSPLPFKKGRNRQWKRRHDRLPRTTDCGTEQELHSPGNTCKPPLRNWKPPTRN